MHVHNTTQFFFQDASRHTSLTNLIQTKPFLTERSVTKTCHTESKDIVDAQPLTRARVSSCLGAVFQLNTWKGKRDGNKNAGHLKIKQEENPTWNTQLI